MIPDAAAFTNFLFETPVFDTTSIIRKLAPGGEAMKSILVPVELHASIDSVLQCARLLAQRFQGHVDGVPLINRSWEVDEFAMPDWTPRMEAYESRIADMVEQARERFTTMMDENTSSESKNHDHPFTHAFDASKTLGDYDIAYRARVFDITVLGRPGKAEGKPRIACAETVLFESGRPVLLAPPDPPSGLGDTIVVAWNQSMESARAAAYAMPLLKTARKVYILTIEAHNVQGPSAETLASKLALHGIPVEIVHKMGKNRAAGLAYLEDGASLGGDLMIKGAYTQSRLREMIFGGATAHILTKAKMPVLMAN